MSALAFNDAHGQEKMELSVNHVALLLVWRGVMERDGAGLATSMPLLQVVSLRWRLSYCQRAFNFGTYRMGLGQRAAIVDVENRQRGSASKRQGAGIQARG